MRIDIVRSAQHLSSHPQSVDGQQNGQPVAMEVDCGLGGLSGLSAFAYVHSECFIDVASLLFHLTIIEREPQNAKQLLNNVKKNMEFSA